MISVDFHQQPRCLLNISSRARDDVRRGRGILAGQLGWLWMLPIREDPHHCPERDVTQYNIITISNQLPVLELSILQDGFAANIGCDMTCFRDSWFGTFSHFICEAKPISFSIRVAKDKFLLFLTLPCSSSRQCCRSCSVHIPISV